MTPTHLDSSFNRTPHIRGWAMLLVLAWPIALTAAISRASDFETVPPQQIGLSQSRLDQITALMEHEVRAGRIAGGVVAIARHGRVGYCQAVGRRDVENNSPMTTDTIFRIASMTKALTSAGILLLHDAKQLALEDPLSKFLPEFQDARVLAHVNGPDMSTVVADRQPTIHQLLTHTSGLTYGWFGPEKLDAVYRQHNIPDLFVPIDEPLADRVRRIANVPLKFQPGSNWDYGVSTDVLGRVIEVVSGLSLETFFQERLFRPLGMQDTHFYLPAEKRSRLSALYTPDDQQRIRLVGNTPVTAGFLKFSADYCLAPVGRFYSGGGGLVSTTADYLRFLQMLLDGGQFQGTRILRRDTVAMMTCNRIGNLQLPFPGHGDGFGYGFGVLTERGVADDVASVGTFSWGGVFNTYFWVDPQEQMVGILMTQLFPYDHLNLREQFKRLAYQAIDDSGFQRVYWYELGDEHANPFFNRRQLRVNAPQASVHPQFAERSETRSSGMARILVDEDLRAVRRADLYCEVWGGHPGTSEKRVSINGRSLYRFPEVGCAGRHCTHQYPTFQLRPMDLVNGYNSLQFACDQGDTFWGHFIVDNAALRIGVGRQDARITAAGLQDFDVSVQADSLGDREGFKLQLQGSATNLAAIAEVHYQGRFFGYDENGNNYSTDWHGMTKDRRPYGMIGSSRQAPFEVNWDTRMLPAQRRVAVRALVEFKELPAVVFTSAIRDDLSIEQPAAVQVTLHGATDLPPEFWSRAGQRKQCVIPLDLEPADILAAELHVVTWTGGAGNVDEYFTLNGHHFPVAEGTSHMVVYSRMPVDAQLLRQGDNVIVLRSDTEHHGIEVLRPGPVLAVRHRVSQ